VNVLAEQGTANLRPLLVGQFNADRLFETMTDQLADLPPGYIPVIQTPDTLNDTRDARTIRRQSDLRYHVLVLHHVCDRTGTTEYP